MILASEMFFRACLVRKESRGWFLREDFKERDDRNFLKWIFLEKKGDEMAISFEASRWRLPLPARGLDGLT